MSIPHRRSERTDPHYTATNPHEHGTTSHLAHPHARPTRAAPHPDVVAAAEFLLAEPDAYLYRRRYLDLITHTPGPDGTTITDYTAAERYLLTTASRRRQALRRASTVHAARTPKTADADADADDDQGPKDNEQS